jgi:hypothetical protein
MMAYGPLRLAVGLVLLTGVSAVQIASDLEQVPLGVPNTATGKKLVSTEALQASIKKDNLLARAEELYKIAKLGEEEYNHPTRVIGSEGKSGLDTTLVTRPALGAHDMLTRYSNRPSRDAVIHLLNSRWAG